MAEYGIIYKNLWGKPKFKVLSNQAKLLLSYIFTCPHSNTLGLFVLHRYYIMADLGWNPEELVEPFNELIKNCWINYDSEANLVLVNNWFEHHFIKNKNQLKKAEAELSELPQSHLFKTFITQLESRDCRLKAQFVKQIKFCLINKLNLVEQSNSYTEPEPEPEPEPETEIGKGPAETSDGFSPGKLMALFNETCVSLPNATTLNKTRISTIKTRWRENPDWDSWRRLFGRIERSAFLTGKVPGKDGAQPFRATLDWILKPSNLTKIIEGNYDRLQKDCGRSELGKYDRFD